MTAGVSKRRRTPRIARVFGALMVSTLAIAGCVGQNSNNSGGNNSGGGNKSTSHTLVIARNMDLIDTDPSTAICDTCQIVFSATYQTLVTLANDNHTLIPEVATSWSANATHTVWTFKLNPKAKFSDGSAITSADVKFSLLRLKNLAGSASYLVSFMKGVTTPDPETAVVTLTRPDWEFPNQMSATYTSVLNAKVVQANGGSDAANAAKADTADHWFQSHSAGSGPYMLQSFTSGQQVTIVANPHYWGPKPYFTRIVMKQTMTAASQAQLLQSGEANIAMQLNPVTAGSLQGQQGITIKTIPSFNVLWIGMSADVKNQYVQGPMTLKVRQAILAAIDYKQLESVLMKGDSKLQGSPIPNGFPGSRRAPAADDEPGAGQEAPGAGGLRARLQADALVPRDQRLRCRPRRARPAAADAAEEGQHQPVAEPGDVRCEHDSLGRPQAAVRALVLGARLLRLGSAVRRVLRPRGGRHDGCPLRPRRHLRRRSSTRSSRSGTSTRWRRAPSRRLSTSSTWPASRCRPTLLRCRCSAPTLSSATRPASRASVTAAAAT